MEKKQMWLRLVQEKSAHYLNLGDGGFDERMRAHLVDCDYEGQTVTYAFPTQDWQINEKGGIHGGAIAGMFDTAFGVVANFTAGENEATTVDLTLLQLKRDVVIGDDTGKPFCDVQHFNCIRSIQVFALPSVFMARRNSQDAGTETTIDSISILYFTP